jgi:hypothetical protein
MSSRPELKVDWCSHAAAEYAVEHWHYSRAMPCGKRLCIGAWEDGRFIGAVVFGSGAGNATDGRRFGLSRSFQVAELVRVALHRHEAPVSRIVAIAVRLLRKQSPGLRLIISFADPLHGHTGAIYQAGNWVYVGQTSRAKLYVDALGRPHHERAVSVTGLKKQFGRYTPCMRPEDAKAIVHQPGKHIYLMPLDDEMRARVLPLAQPYPKRARSETSDTSATHAEEGGATPTLALQEVTV